jgi:uncharacterized protein (TIGR03435 family)
MARTFGQRSVRRFLDTPPAIIVLVALMTVGLIRGVKADSALEGMAPVFTVASFVKTSDVDPKWGGLRHLPGQIRAPRDTVVELIEIAYDVQAAQIRGAPEWARSVRYDITLQAPESSFVGPFHGEAQAQRMLKTLLADRFKLVFHRESGSVSAAALVVAPGGVTMMPSEHQPNEWQGVQLAPGRLIGQAAPMSRLTWIIAQSSGQTTLDLTGLTSTYDFDAHWQADSAGASSRQWHYGHQWQVDGDVPPLSATSPNDVLPSFDDALLRRLGLVLEPAKERQAERIVVDNVEQPPI